MKKASKTIASLVLVATILASSATVPVSARTINDVVRNPDTFLSESYSYSAEYSKVNCAPNYGAITATNTNYYGSYKTLTYIVQKKIGVNSYSTISSNTNSGVSRTVTTSVSYDTGLAARRHYSAACYVASNTGSGIVDSYIIDVFKSLED